MSSGNSQARQSHWIKTRNLTVVIMALWFFFAFVVHWFATPLNEMKFLGFPLGYYMAAQGSLIAFVVLIFVHNWMQDKIDDEFGVGDE